MSKLRSFYHVPFGANEKGGSSRVKSVCGQKIYGWQKLAMNHLGNLDHPMFRAGGMLSFAARRGGGDSRSLTELALGLNPN